MNECEERAKVVLACGERNREAGWEMTGKRVKQVLLCSFPQVGNCVIVNRQRAGGRDHVQGRMLPAMEWSVRRRR